MLKYLNKLVYFSEEGDSPTSIVEKRKTLTLKFKNLKHICMNGITNELQTAKNSVTTVIIEETHRGEQDSSCLITVKYTKSSLMRTTEDASEVSLHLENQYTINTNCINLYYNKEIDWLDLNSKETYADKYTLKYNTLGLFILESAADLKWLRKDYPDMEPNLLIDDQGRIIVSYMYGISKTLQMLGEHYNCKEKDYLSILSELKYAHVAPTSAIVPVCKNIGVLLEAYSHVVMSFHLRYNPIIFSNIKGKNYCVGNTLSGLHSAMERHCRENGSDGCIH